VALIKKQERAKSKRILRLKTTFSIKIPLDFQARLLHWNS